MKVVGMQSKEHEIPAGDWRGLGGQLGAPRRDRAPGVRWTGQRPTEASRPPWQCRGDSRSTEPSTPCRPYKGAHVSFSALLPKTGLEIPKNAEGLWGESGVTPLPLERNQSKGCRFLEPVAPAR